MQRNKTLFVTLLLAMLTLSATMQAADTNEINGIRVATNEKDAGGKEIVFDFYFSSKPKLVYHFTYDEDQLLSGEISISATDVKNIYGQEEIILSQDKMKSISFIHVSATGISPTHAVSNLKVMTSANSITMTGILPGETVRLYTVDGKMVNSVTASANGYVHLSTLSGVVYLVKVGSASFKIMTK